jgi:tetratricopeptide (TPR) repeat protein
LGAECILEGSVRRAGNQVRITAQLIEGSDGTNKWAESFDACLMDPAQVFAIQEDIAREITVRLARFFKTGAPDSAVSQAQTFSVPAYESYLRARKLMREMSADSLRHAIPLLEQAIAEDPGYAAAYAALGGCYGHLGIYGGVGSAEVLPKARHWAEEAVRRDPSLADGHTLLGNVAATLDLDLESARVHFERALEVDPQSPYARQSRAQWYLGPSGQTGEAVNELESLLPLDPLSLDLRHTYIATLYFDRRYADAIEQATTVLKFTPQSWAAYFYRWLAYEALGDKERAIEDLASHAALLPNLMLDRHLASYQFERAGRHEEAVAIALEMENNPRAPIIATVLVDLWLRLGDHARALDWLERAYQSRSFRVLSMGVDAAYDPLRGEPRFEALCRQVLGDVVLPRV